MAPMNEKWQARYVRYGKRAQLLPPPERNDRVVHPLAAVTLVLMAAGLYADVRLGSHELKMLCYFGAVVFGGAMLAFHRNKRLFIQRPPLQ